MEEILQILTKAVVFLLMTLLGIDCTREGIAHSLKRPGLAGTVVFGQFLIIPLVMCAACSMAGPRQRLPQG